MSEAETVEAVPHVDVVKSNGGWIAVIHQLNGVGPRVIYDEVLDQLHARVASAMISEYGISQHSAHEHTARNVEDTIMAAHQRGVMGMTKQLQDANKALAAAQAEVKELKKK